MRVAAPQRVSDESVRLAVVGKLSWIKRQRKKFKDQSRQSPRQMVTGESHYFLGKRYRLRVIEKPGSAKVILKGSTTIELHVRPGTNVEKCRQVMQEWHRTQLKELIAKLLPKWERTIGVNTSDWGIKKMRTKWGSCNTCVKRIWLNLELAKKPQSCIEFVLVHELVHLLERKHNDRFIGFMDKLLPKWRHRRDELNAAPLGHEEWGY